MHILLLLCLLVVQAMGCPSDESIAPHCLCKDLGDGPMLLCSNVTRAEELIPPLKATDSRPMFSLAIIDSSLLYLPEGIFRNTRYQKVRFSNSQIMSLSDSDLAFEGLEEHLEEIRADGAHYITSWDWSQLRNLKRLQYIDIHLISMYSVDQEFPRLDSLTSLGISRAEISFLHPTVFSQLHNLRMLILKENEITEMERSMLPDPANQLFLLDLRGNQISALPEDMFSNLPTLEELDLSNNRFIYLDDDTFASPFERLGTVLLGDNPFRCDCRMSWLVKAKKPSTFEASCSLPADLKGVPLKYLTDAVLWC